MSLDDPGLRTMVKQSDIEYVSMVEQDFFSAAVDSIPENGVEIET